jgi:ABC-type lipoprotein release transport system permease subunit
MILGGGLLMFTLALGDGTHESWIESAVRMGSGHVTVQSSEFKLSRRIEDRMPAGIRAAAEQSLRMPSLSKEVQAVSATLAIRGLASSSAGARPVQIVGVHPEFVAAFSVLDEKSASRAVSVIV